MFFSLSGPVLKTCNSLQNQPLISLIGLWRWHFFIIFEPDLRRIQDGDRIVPIFIPVYLNVTARELIAEQIAGCLGDGGHFLVEVRVHPGKAVVFIDHRAGVTLDDCIRVARCLEQRPELEDVFARHALEVSSPGLDEPLKVLPQYQKREGQRVHVLTTDGMKREGLLRDVTEAGIGLEMTTVRKNGKQRETVTTVLHFPFDQIKETRINYSIHQLLK